MIVLGLYYYNSIYFTGTSNTFVQVTVDVLQRYTIVNCISSVEYDYLSCHVEYGQDCENLTYGKERSATMIQMFHYSSSTSILPCIVSVLTADNQSHSVKVQGSFNGMCL